MAEIIKTIYNLESNPPNTTIFYADGSEEIKMINKTEYNWKSKPPTKTIFYADGTKETIVIPKVIDKMVLNGGNTVMKF